MGKYDKQRQQVAAHFENLGISQNCSACDSDDWEIAMIDHQMSMVMGGKKFKPMFLYCNNCGRMVQYDAMKLGVG